MIFAFIPAFSAAEIGADGVYLVEYSVGGGEGSSENYYNNDYIILRNGGAEDVSLDGWSIQLLESAERTVASKNVYPLSGTIKANSFFLIICAKGKTASRDIPIGGNFELSGLDLTSSGHKLALVKNTVALSNLTNANIPTNNSIADFVGTVNATESLYLGAGAANSPANTQCLTRTGYTNDNAADWDRATRGAYPILKGLIALGSDGGASTAAANSLIGWTFGIKGIDTEIPTADAAYTQTMNLGSQIHFNGTITGGKFYSNGTTTIGGASYTTYSYGATSWHYESENTDDGKGFYFSFYSTNYRNLAISFWAKSSKAGPKNLQVQVKLDGVWTDVPGAILTLDNADSGKTLTSTAINLPIWDSDELVEMRILRVGTECCETAADGNNEIQSTGSCQIDDLMITGVPMEEGEILRDAPGRVSASPDPALGSVRAGTQITLTCETADAQIYYKAGDKDYQLIENGGKITLYNGAVITAYGYIENAYGGEVSEFDYTIDNTGASMGSVIGTGPVVIQELYGAGGNRGSLYTTDYVVLRNISDRRVSIGGWSLLYASQNQAFSTTQAQTLCYTFEDGVSIRAHGYLLVRCAAGTSGAGAYALTDYDVTASLNLTGSGGKLALVEDANTCTGSDDPNLVDMVCWGSPNDYLGNGPALGVDDVLYCLTRANYADETVEADPFGGSYTGDNLVDFVVARANPKSSISAGSAEEYVASVTSPQADVLPAGTAIELTCETEGATIYYTIDQGATYQAYSAPFTTENDTLEIRAYAVRPFNGVNIRSDYSDMSFVFLSGEGSYTISQARVLQEGTEVTVTGVVTFLETNAYGTITTFTMQDETAGITVRGYANALEGVEIGKKVTVSGTRSSYRGLEQIINPELKSVPILGKMPEPIVATAAQLIDSEFAEQHESMYVLVQNARMDSINYTGGYGGTPPATSIIDDTGAVNIHYIPTLSEVVKGDIVNVYAVLTQNAQDLIAYADGYFLRVASEDWIQLVEHPTKPDEDYSIASWNQGTGSGTNQMLASSGEYAWRSVVSNGDDAGNAYEFGTSKSSINCKGWNYAGRYLQFEFSTEGFSDILISAMLRSSASGPRNFIMQYSLDGETFVNIEGSEFSVVYNAANDSLKQVVNRFALPEELADKPVVYLRWTLTDNIRADGSGAISSAGALNFTGVSIIGQAIESELDITALPGAGIVPLGQNVALSCDDGEAEIYYRQYIAPVYEEGEEEDDLVDRTDDNWLKYEPASEIQLSELPYTLQAYAVSGGERGRIFTFDYVQQQCEPVKSTDYTGALKEGKEVVLTTATEGALIRVTVMQNFGQSGATTYTAWALETWAVSFDAAQFPVRIEAYAEKEGCLNSETLIIDFTLKQTGGEELYFGQIHSHTTLSDGVGSIDDAYNYAKNSASNVDFLIVTDHSNYLDSRTNLGTMDGENLGTLTSYVNDAGETVSITKWELGKLTADKYTDSTFVADFGYEMTWSGQYGHINTYATDGFVSRNDGTYTISGGAGLVNYYELLTRYPQSISMFNHPGTTFGTFDDYAYYTEEYDQVITLIEVGNGEGAIGSAGYWPSYEQYTRALDKGWHLAPANNQDNHKGRWGDANTARDVAWTNDFTRNGILQAMREMRMYATEDENLEITYFVNGEPLGTIFETTPSSLNFEVSVYDPDVSDKSFKLSIIANNGKTVYSQSGVVANGSPCEFNFTLLPEDTYYFVRVDQSDGNIAVTAPIWVGEIMKVGVESLTADVDFPVAGEAIELSTLVYNDETTDFVLTGISYAVEGGAEIATKQLSKALRDGERYTDVITYTPQSPGAVTIVVTATGTIDGREYSFTASLELNVLLSSDILNIAIDASHNNYYVSGDSAASYLRLSEIAALFNGRVTLIENGITAASLREVDLLILTAPYDGYNAGGASYTSAELSAIKGFADAGGSILITGKSDRGDGAVTANDKLNGVLAAIGTGTRLRSDTVVDLTQSSVTSFNLTFKRAESFMYEHRLLAEVEAYSSGSFAYYSGSSVAMGSGADAVISGNSTTFGTPYSNLEAETPNLPIDEDNVTVSGTDTTLVSCETLAGGGFLVVSGMSFFNDYQIPEMENAAQTFDVNYYLTRNLIMSAVGVTPIATVRNASEGRWFAVEGTVTTNASGHDVNTAFFDSIYVQDASGGINLFPVSGDFAIGQRVWACGFVGGYQGDSQLNDVQIYLMDGDSNPVEPKYTTTYDSMRSSNQGQLVYIEGVVESVSLNEGVVEYIMVNDGSGVSRVFIDGYIYCDCPSHAKNASGHDLSWIRAGSIIRVTGIASTGMHPDETGIDQLLPRIRIRNRAEIVRIDSYTPQEPPSLLYGDADCNGELEAADAAAILRAVVRLSELSAEGKLNAEVTGDGEVDAADAAAILRRLVRIIDRFPVEE
ncbi:MAG: lamin tail domain-containing protein [Clostridia bacterium]|nr:lamin tail domain-containing protein [Clostridia bacterium]